MKRTTILNLSFVLVICMLLCSCKNDSLPECTDGIVKAKLASIELMEEAYINAYNTIESVVKSGSITADGYNGVCDHPDRVVNGLERNISLINNALNFLYEVDMDSSKIDKCSIEGHYACDILTKIQNIQVVFSKPIPVETSKNKTKVWTFTELNSGYEFIASYDKKEDIVNVSLSGKGEEKLDKEMAVYVENVRNIYEKYTDVVATEYIKREQRRAIRRAEDPNGIDWLGIYFGD